MAHLRKQLRDGVKAGLDTVLIAVPVYSGRIVPFRDTELPAVNILPIGDAAAGERQNGDRYERQTDVAVAVLVSGRQDAAWIMPTPSPRSLSRR